jgi:spore maturation protein CgeB
MHTRERNEKALRERFPGLYDLYVKPFGEKGAAGKDGADIEVSESKSGKPALKYKGVAIHSMYKPEEESARPVAGLDEGTKKVWVFGLGFGYHLQGFLEKGFRVSVIEPSPEIFLSAVNNADMSEIFKKCEIFVGSGYRQKLYSSDLSESAKIVHMPYRRGFENELAKFESAFMVRSFLARKRLKVLLVSPIYGGSETTYRYVADALENLGVEVGHFDATFFSKSFFRLGEITKNQQHLALLRSKFTNMLSEAIAASADEQKPDLLLAMAQAPLEMEAVTRIREGLKIPTAFWFVEDFRTLKYWDKIAGHYDYFFTIQRGEFFEKLAKAGAKHVECIPQAASPAIHKPMELSEDDMQKYGSDISFMGAGYRNRREFFKGLLDYDFKIWGTEWNLADPVGRLVQNRNERMKPEEYIKVFNASKININLHSSTQLAGIDPVGDFVNPRVFEIAACGAFQMVDQRAALPPLMEAGKELVTFSSLKDLREKIDYYLKNEEEREEIARAGRVRALADHTFERRVEEMLRMIIENEGDRLGQKESRYDTKSRNIVKNMIEEAGDKPDLVEFLKKFDPEKPLSLKEVMEKISGGEGALSKVEGVFQMVDQVLIEK